VLEVKIELPDVQMLFAGERATSASFDAYDQASSHRQADSSVRHRLGHPTRPRANGYGAQAPVWRGPAAIATINAAPVLSQCSG
jgi:hypothetical protein